ncbi:hypothetical protein BKA70DRAFT_1214458 [Coprinopsis sp. MPI-PUGE-AT-0042]|nr:hypothetical protein BKA70DRAFT_1214458 [Coprinopsis sp. MPI-PUGE-AT-0042]
MSTGSDCPHRILYHSSTSYWLNKRRGLTLAFLGRYEAQGSHQVSLDEFQRDKEEEIYLPEFGGGWLGVGSAVDVAKGAWCLYTVSLDPRRLERLPFAAVVEGGAQLDRTCDPFKCFEGWHPQEPVVGIAIFGSKDMVGALKRPLFTHEGLVTDSTQLPMIFASEGFASRFGKPGSRRRTDDPLALKHGTPLHNGHVMPSSESFAKRPTDANSFDLRGIMSIWHATRTIAALGLFGWVYEIWRESMLICECGRRCGHLHLVKA